jgi:hypothetical protein
LGCRAPLTGVVVGAADALQRRQVEQHDALVQANKRDQVAQGVHAQRRDGARVLGHGRNLVATLEHLDGTLGRREDELAASPHRIRDGRADGHVALELVGLDRVDGGVALGAGNGSVAALEGEGCRLGHWEGG